MQNLRWIPVFVLSVFAIYGGTAWCVSAKHQLQVSVAARQALEVSQIARVETQVNGQATLLETYLIKVRSNDSSRTWTVYTNQGEAVLSGKKGLTEIQYQHAIPLDTPSGATLAFSLVSDV